MQNADAALNSVITGLQRAITLGVEGANGTLSDADRQALAMEVQGIQSDLLNLANLSYQGSFVFAGTATQTAPYISDSTGVHYVGNSAINQITVGNHFTVQGNLPGSQLFSCPGHDVFQAMSDLIEGLQSGTGIDRAVNEVGDASRNISAQRVFFGNSVNQLNSQETYLNSESTQLAQQQSTLGGADLTKVISNLVNAQTSREATLEAVGRTQQSNLFDYLK